LICRRSCLGVSPLGIGFRQEIPGGFEIRQKNSRRLTAGRLEVDFKKPFNLLAKMPAEARGEAPSEATNSIWWSLYQKVRTHFQQNPD